MKRLLVNVLLLLALWGITPDARSEEVRVATASNFRDAASEIAKAFDEVVSEESS